MGRSYANVMFTPRIKEQQTVHGSRAAYERYERYAEPGDRLSPMERRFLLERDSFYIASTTENGWPYIQHRGGPRGFLHVFDDTSFGFADLRGNKQYISVGNLLNDDRVSLFFMDYPNQLRLKIIGHARIHEGPEAKALIDELYRPEVQVPVERAIVIHIVALDWNCSQHITPRFTQEQVLLYTQTLRERIADLENENTRLRGIAENRPEAQTK